jgi:SAM-dependent methyltransferase
MARDERLYPDFTNGLFAWHLFRYGWALPYAYGRDVLDLGCGSGYGVALLAGVARSVLGVDYDREVVAECKELYGGIRNVQFAAMDAPRLALGTGRFGLVTCFEVLEHLPSGDASAAMAEMARVLERGGVLLASTPNRLVEIPHYRAAGLKYNRHINYYSPRELRRDLSKHFRDLQLLGQVPCESLGKRMLRWMDIFNLRHHLIPRGMRAWVNRWRSHGQGGMPPDLGGFQVKRYLVRQSGVLLALCRKR